MTVRNHVQSILEKLGVHSRLEAVAYATGHRLL
jgi:DNA-binding NarL/FixJ family response regulator